jgi:hypothetical protein
MADSIHKIPFGRLLLISIADILLFIIAAGVGIIVYKETTMQQIVCPPVVNGETFIQSITDGNEIICMYSVTPPTNKKLIRKQGTFK